MAKLRKLRMHKVRCSCGGIFVYKSLNKTQKTIRCPHCKKRVVIKHKLRTVSNY